MYIRYIFATLIQYSFKKELHGRNKLISSKRPFKILQNETKIVKIQKAVLEIFNFKIEIWTVFREKTTEKPKMVFFRGFAKTEKQWIVWRRKW